MPLRGGAEIHIEASIASPRRWNHTQTSILVPFFSYSIISFIDPHHHQSSKIRLEGVPSASGLGRSNHATLSDVHHPATKLQALFISQAYDYRPLTRHLYSCNSISIASSTVSGLHTTTEAHTGGQRGAHNDKCGGRALLTAFRASNTIWDVG